MAQNKRNVSIAYIIGSGKTGTWYGTGVNAFEYKISIPKAVSLPYTWPQKKEPINQIERASKKARTEPSMYFFIGVHSIRDNIHITSKKPNIAPKSEKLYSLIIKNWNGSLINFISFQRAIT